MLTARQEETMRFIQGFKETEGQWPSYGEIGVNLGITEPAAYRLVTVLVGAGCIKRTTSDHRKRRHRWFEILKPVAICLSTCSICTKQFDPAVMTWVNGMNFCPICAHPMGT